MEQDNNRIEVGDMVIVNINGAGMTLIDRARVEHVPCATGDSWIFKDVLAGGLYYVSEGCTIRLLEKARLIPSLTNP